MSRVGSHDIDIRRRFPARLSEVDRFCHSLREEMAGTAWKRWGFTIELILRELLNNAVIHGCRRQAQLRVYCRLRITGQALFIRVGDPGAGFNWRTRRLQQQSPPATSGRGMELLKMLCSHVLFNAKGNVITVCRPLGGKSPSGQSRPATNPH